MTTVTVKLRKDKYGDMVEMMQPSRDGYMQRCYIDLCSDGLAKFFGVRPVDMETRIDLVMSTTKIKDSFKIEIPSNIGAYDCIIDGRSIYLRATTVRRFAQLMGTSTFYVRVEVDA